VDLNRVQWFAACPFLAELWWNVSNSENLCLHSLDPRLLPLDCHVKQGTISDSLLLSRPIVHDFLFRAKLNCSVSYLSFNESRSTGCS
jgi:hypothetical protein